jgi:predicted TIM-barrel fold metal-dependent hydrolase
LTEYSRSRVTSPIDAENNPLLTEEAQQKARRAIEERAARMKAMRLPSEMFREHVYGCFINDPLGLRLIDDLGEDNVMIETDFPHLTSMWPHSMAQATASLEGLDQAVKDKVLRGNAERVFKFKAAEPAVSR